MGNFIKDKKRGEIGEKIAFQVLESEYPKTEILKAQGKQPDWDFAIGKMYFEVKYDEMAFDTGNICFEVSNGTKLTGIFASKSHEILYVIPTKKSKEYQVFKFNRIKLLKWLDENPTLTRAVNGGDRNKFSLLLVKRDILISNISKFGNCLTWVEKE